MSAVFVPLAQRQLVNEAYHGNIENVKMLLAMGTDVNFQCSLNPGAKTARSPLEAAVANNQHETFYLLLDHGARITSFVLNRAAGVFSPPDPQYNYVRREITMRSIMLLQRHLEYARMPKELFGALLTYLV